MMPIYLDYNATTPVDPRVIDAMLPYLRDHFGNPSSTHSLGRLAHEAVERGREQVARLLGAAPAEIIFTGGGSEASNQALKGIAFPALFGGGRGGRCHIITSAIEHPATLAPCRFLETLGCKITVVPVDRQGLVDVDEVSKAIGPDTKLISVMHANNEVGTLQPIRALGRLARERDILLHTDAAQSLGKVAIDVDDMNVDLLTVAGHKLYAPKGIGVLYVRAGVKLEPLVHGAGHEAGRRAGTENVPYIVALGEACAIAGRELPEAETRLRRLRDRLWQQLRAGLGDRLSLNGHPELRLPNTLNVNFVGHVGADLLRRVPEIAASTGSACHEGQVALSPVLRAMGVPPEFGQGALRLTVGRFTTEADADRAAQLLINAARPTP